MRTTFYLLITGLFIFFNSALKAECTYNQAIEAGNFQVGIMLTWSTLAEVNHERFIIEKSNDGIQFEEIGTVTGGGSTQSVQEYNFLHIYPSEHRLFYRLKEVSFDGVISYSDITIFENEDPTLVRVVRLSDVFAANDFNVKLDSYTEGQLDYVLKNWKGKEMFSESVALTNGLNDINIKVDDLPLGIYKLGLFLDSNPMDILTFKKIDPSGEERTPVARKND